jgi:AcrR family transcriptional regulator
MRRANDRLPWTDDGHRPIPRPNKLYDPWIQHRCPPAPDATVTTDCSSYDIALQLKRLAATAILCRMSEPALRVDARRNVERILTAALRVLSADPAASMEQIAAASDVHRTTIYRRFPTREALIDGLIERELHEARAMVSAASRLPPSEPALHELCAEVVALGARYAFLMAHHRPSGTDTIATGVVELLARYQQAGVLRDDVPARWLGHAFGALAVAVVEARWDMDLDDDGAADLLARSFLEGARAPDRSRGR